MNMNEHEWSDAMNRVQKGSSAGKSSEAPYNCGVDRSGIAGKTLRIVAQKAACTRCEIK